MSSSKYEIIDEYVNACPFCDEHNLKYSVKKAEEGVYHGAVYCTNCYAYGPRVRFIPVKSNRHEAQNDINAKEDAIWLWNKRENIEYVVLRDDE